MNKKSNVGLYRLSAGEDVEPQNVSWRLLNLLTRELPPAVGGLVVTEEVLPKGGLSTGHTVPLLGKVPLVKY